MLPEARKNPNGGFQRFMEPGDEIWLKKPSSGIID